MAIKKITLRNQKSRLETEPRKLFESLTLRGTVENIWGPQQHALDAWHDARENQDCVVQMNTGGGKTLVGLVIAQCLQNEQKGNVVYACANNQLIEQTEAKAAELGIAPATRYLGNWKNKEKFLSNDTFCITNYASLFNGYSVFRDLEIAGVIFDDSHLCEHLIRRCYTIEIPHASPMFRTILDPLGTYFRTSSQAARYRDILEERHSDAMFLPMFIMKQHAERIRQVLIENKIDDDENNKYAWNHLKEKLPLLCMVVDHQGIELVPPICPLRDNRCFTETCRRLYLTATIPSDASIRRTFGKRDYHHVFPTGKSGDAQRLIVFCEGNEDQDRRNHALALSEGKKACLIAPSKKQLERWGDAITVFDSKSGQSEIDRFSQSREPEILGFAARYDGIDLPGDECRLLLIDDLPYGEALFHRFMDESVRVEVARRANEALRITQAIGRIFRSNTDHGVVILIGERLQTWVEDASNRRLLPQRLQQQIQLALDLRRNISEGTTNHLELIEGILAGDSDWDTLYNDSIDAFKTLTAPDDISWYVDTVAHEWELYCSLWDGNWYVASDGFARLATDTRANNERLSAWYFHFAGHAFSLGGNDEEANQLFNIAGNIRSELGRPDHVAIGNNTITNVSEQAKRIATGVIKNKKSVITTIKQVGTDLIDGPETAKAEEAMRALGTLLGLVTYRPDKGQDEGPDVIWHDEKKTAWQGFELKTNKGQGSEYSKGEISTCLQYLQWVVDNYGDNSNLIVVGPATAVSSKCNPSRGLELLQTPAVQELFARTKKAYEQFIHASPSKLEFDIQMWLDHLGLVWPKCVEALPTELAIDRKRR